MNSKSLDYLELLCLLNCVHFINIIKTPHKKIHISRRKMYSTPAKVLAA